MEKRVTLLDRGQVKFTDQNGVDLYITAEHAKDGGWTLEVKFPVGETVFIDLPSRVLGSGLGSAMAGAATAMSDLSNALGDVSRDMIGPVQPYDWGRKS